MITYIKSMQDYKKEIKEGRVLVDFFATWCGPCNMLTPNLEELSELDQNLKIIKVDVDTLMEIAALYNVQSIPTLLFFENGSLKRKDLGYKNLSQLKNFVL